MSDPKRPYRHLSEDQLTKYLKGKLKGEEAHEVERLMLDSPLEAEAMEGWEAFETDAIQQDLATLRDRLDAKKKSKKIPWLQLAASIAVIATLGITIWMIGNPTSDQEYLAEKTTVEKTEAAPVTTPVEKEEMSDVDYEEEIVVEEIVVPEEKPIVKQPVIAEKKEQEESVTTEIQTTEEVLAELIFEEEDDFVADMLIEPEEIDEVELITETIPEIPAEVPLKSTIAAAKPVEEENAKKEESKNVARMAATGAVSRSVGFPPRRVVGVVLDEIDEIGIPGVNVIVKGTTNGTTTDLDGRFSIEVDPSDEELQFSFIGMQDISLPIQDSVVAIMPVDVMSLSEVVVTGYGEARNASITDVDPPYEYESAYPTEGRGNYKDYIEQNLQYPAEALSNAIAGTVKLKATILSNGTVGEIEVIKGIGYGCDEEAIRLVRVGPEWTPAEKNGQKITSEVSIKIRFKLP